MQACCNIVNEYLTAHGTEGTNFKVVRLANLEDFDLGGVLVDEGCEIALRMNSFQQTLKIKQAFAQARKQDAKMQVKYKAMPPNYYDSKLSSVFESCIRNKFVGLRSINEIQSDYIKHFTRQAEESK